MWRRFVDKLGASGGWSATGCNFLVASVDGTASRGVRRSSRLHGLMHELHSVNVTTSKERWHDAPDGLEFNVRYIDTHKDPAVKSPASPAVLLVHGAVGSHKDFFPLVNRLAAAGIRAIVPNMPGCGFTTAASVPKDMDIFSHTIPERTEFLVDFLAAIEVGRVHAAVGHSLGSAAAVSLAAVTDAVGAVVVINPVTHKPHRAARPVPLLRFGTALWDRKLARLLMLPFLSVSRVAFGFGFGSPYAMASAMMTAANCNFNQVYSDALQVVFRKIPFTLVYSMNDHIIEPHLSQEFCSLLGLSPVHCAMYDKHKNRLNPTESLNENRHLKGVILQKGGHFPIKEYGDLLTDQIKESIGLLNP